MSEWGEAVSTSSKNDFMTQCRLQKYPIPAILLVMDAWSILSVPFWYKLVFRGHSTNYMCYGHHWYLASLIGLLVEACGNTSMGTLSGVNVALWRFCHFLNPLAKLRSQLSGDIHHVLCISYGVTWRNATNAYKIMQTCFKTAKQAFPWQIAAAGGFRIFWIPVSVTMEVQ